MTGGAAGSTDAESGPAGHGASALHWVPTDDSIGRHPDRQILIVGDTVVGVTLAALLRQAGYDPLVVSGREPRSDPVVIYLWPTALRVLDSVGVASRVLGHSCAVRRVSVGTALGTGEDASVCTRDPETGVVSPRVVRTSDLHRAVGAVATDGDRIRERSVETVSATERGVDVEFEDGVHERFDIVVDAGGGDRRRRCHRGEPHECARLTQYVTCVESGSADASRLSDRWHESALVQRLPHPIRDGVICRVTTPSEVPASRLGDRTGVPSAVADGDSRSVHQVVLERGGIDRAWWGRDRVACCGPAACPVAPASGFGVSYGIEDALAFVSELTRGPRPATDVVATYADRRSRRLWALERTAARVQRVRDSPIPALPDPPFASIALFRTVAVGPFVDPTLGTLQSDEFT